MTIFERVSIGFIPQEHSKPYTTKTKTTKAWAFSFFVGYFGGYPKIAPETILEPVKCRKVPCTPWN